MSAISEVQGGGAPAHTLTHEGRVYRLRPIDWDMMADLERHLYEIRVASLGMVRKTMDPAAYQTRLDALVRQYEDGEFTLHSEKGKAYYLTTEPRALAGPLYLMGQVFGCTPAEAARLLLARGPEVNALLKIVMNESLPWARFDGDGDPNPQPPGTVPSPGPL